MHYNPQQPNYQPQPQVVYVPAPRRRKRTMHVWHWIGIILTGGLWALPYAYILWHRRK